MISNGPKFVSEAASDAKKWAHLILQLQLVMVSNGPQLFQEAPPIHTNEPTLRLNGSFR
jgi:hypothetical protein